MFVSVVVVYILCLHMCGANDRETLVDAHCWVGSDGALYVCGYVYSWLADRLCTGVHILCVGVNL